ncbi:MAG: hypothetical protein ACFCVH_15480 [Alphaproteobacteria bacterium]
MGGAEYLIAAGLGALQTVQGIASSRQDASWSRQQADHARAQAAADAVDRRRETQRALGKRRASLGAAGITVEGSPVEVLADLAGEGELAARRIEAEGKAAASGHRYQARRSERAAGRELLQGAGDVVGQVARAGKEEDWW